MVTQVRLALTKVNQQDWCSRF